MDIALLIDAPLEDVWSLLIDTSRWPEWGPSVCDVESEDRYIQSGSHGRVKTPLGIWLTYRITSFTPQERWTWDVAGIPATGHRVESAPDGRTRLIFEVPLVAAPYGGICYLAGKRIEKLLAQQSP